MIIRRKSKNCKTMAKDDYGIILSQKLEVQYNYNIEFAYIKKGMEGLILKCPWWFTISNILGSRN